MSRRETYTPKWQLKSKSYGVWILNAKIENQCAFNGWFHTGYLVLGTIKKSKSSSILNCHWNTGAFIFFILFFIFILLISDIMLLWHTHRTTSDPVSTQTCNQWWGAFSFHVCLYFVLPFQTFQKRTRAVKERIQNMVCN